MRMKNKTKFALIACLFGVEAIAVQSLDAAPVKTSAPAISQMVITQYTGADNPQAKGEPIYRLLLREDGTAIYVGSKTYRKRIGRYEGKVARSDYLKIANLFQKDNFQKWENSYPKHRTHSQASERFDITYGNQEKSIVSSGEEGPRTMMRASNIFYGLLWKINWNKVSDSDAISE